MGNVAVLCLPGRAPTGRGCKQHGTDHKIRPLHLCRLRCHSSRFDSTRGVFSPDMRRVRLDPTRVTPASRGRRRGDARRVDTPVNRHKRGDQYHRYRCGDQDADAEGSLVNAKHDLARRDPSAAAKSGVHPNDAPANLRGKIDLRGGLHDSRTAHGDGPGARGDTHGFDERYPRRRLAALSSGARDTRETAIETDPATIAAAIRSPVRLRIMDDSTSRLHV